MQSSYPVIGVLGSTGFLGQHVLNDLSTNHKVIGGSRRIGVDGRSVDSINKWINTYNITHIINLAAECGGIGLNKEHPAQLWLATTLITSAVLEASRINNIMKLCMVGTVCCYARDCPTPFKEEYLMHYGIPESTNAAYGVAKLSGLFGCQSYRQEYNLNAIYLLPVNLYGPGDNFNPKSSHVIPALIKKCILARDTNTTMECWGTGTATREFLYVKDAAKAISLAIERYNKSDPINIGNGVESSICQLVETIARLCKFKGKIVWNSGYPDGQPRRCLDTSKAEAEFGFKATTSLEDGLASTIEWYEKQLSDGTSL